MRPLLARIARAFRRAAADEVPVVRLEDVRRRLELLVAALYGRAIPIASVEAPRRSALTALLRPVPAHLRGADALASTDGERILLPETLPDTTPGAAAALYRVLAMEQAERLARGTAAFVPGPDAPLERDLYLLLESVAVDEAIVRMAPGLAPALAAERAAALARRPPRERLTPLEQNVEDVVRRVLAAPLGQPPAEVAVSPAAADSLAQARAMAGRLVSARAPYRGVSAVATWGTVTAPSAAAEPSASPEPEERPAEPNASSPQRMLDVPQAASRRKGTEPGDVLADEGLQGDAPETPSPSDDAVRGGPGSPASQAPREDDGSAVGPVDAPPTGVGAAPSQEARAKDAGTASYPEWDWRGGRYVPRGATVHHVDALDGDDAWSAEVLRQHGATVRRLREKFERLRARRLRLNRQRDGDELDLAACISALADARAGLPVDDRLYTATRPARRGLAILLLVDISGSTIDEVERGVRIIDLEKVALLLTAEALDALGDTYAVLTFSGQGAHGVRMRTIKDFGDRNGEAQRRRIAALRPEGFTRLGAAVRHATAHLARAEAGHRLLLLISDGKPNDDDDAYVGRYGIEDSRQAVAEARRAGIFPFCLTVDRTGSAYLPRIFGKAGHEILNRPSQLPFALSRLVEHLLRS
jgi:nitric oxide reductase NorD protein